MARTHRSFQHLSNLEDLEWSQNQDDGSQGGELERVEDNKVIQTSERRERKGGKGRQASQRCLTEVGPARPLSSPSKRDGGAQGEDASWSTTFTIRCHVPVRSTRREQIGRIWGYLPGVISTSAACVKRGAVLMHGPGPPRNGYRIPSISSFFLCFLSRSYFLFRKIYV